MKKIFLNDVGDGLNVVIKDHHDCKLMVDFGGDKHKVKDYNYFFKGDFLLSHFHYDHYNGIVINSSHGYWQIGKFYFPEMPEFPESREFLSCVLSFNIWLSIKNNDPIQSTIFNALKKLNHDCPIKPIPLSQGDIFDVGYNRYEVLWPPKVLKENYILKSIKKAIEDFNEAKKIDDRLQTIYKKIHNSLDNDTLNLEKISEINFEFSEKNYFEKKDVFQKANDSLKKATNRLSLAFKQEDNLLFLGDLEKGEIRRVVKDLKENKFFEFLIAPHHGTHWDDILSEIRANICLVSTGNKLSNKFNYKFKEISDIVLKTDIIGDIKIKKRYCFNRFCLNFYPCF